MTSFRIIWYIIFIVVLNSSSTISQVKTLEGVLGMKWGISQTEVHKLMSKKAKRLSTSKYVTVYEKGNFAGRNVDEWVFLFHHNQFYGVIMDFREYQNNDKKEDENTFEKSNIGKILLDELIEKYGTPEKTDYKDSEMQREYYWSPENGKVEFFYDIDGSYSMLTYTHNDLKLKADKEAEKLKNEELMRNKEESIKNKRDL